MTSAEYIVLLEAKNTAGASLTWEVVYAPNAAAYDTLISVSPDPETTVVPDAHIIITASAGASSLIGFPMVSRFGGLLQGA